MSVEYSCAKCSKNYDLVIYTSGDRDIVNCRTCYKEYELEIDDLYFDLYGKERLKERNKRYNELKLKVKLLQEETKRASYEQLGKIEGKICDLEKEIEELEENEKNKLKMEIEELEKKGELQDKIYNLIDSKKHN